MNKNTQKIVIAALFAALTCVATMIIKIPSPLKGYVNLGDCMVLLAGWMLSPFYGFLAAGLGSALADLFSGYANYAPITFIIKGLMAIIAYYVFKLLNKKIKAIPSRIISGLCAEALMVGGYYLFEGFMFGFILSLVNILPNGIQGIVGIIIGTVLVAIFEKSKIKFH